MTTPQQLHAIADKLQHIADGGTPYRTAFGELAYLELRLSESGINVLLESIRELRNAATACGSSVSLALDGESIPAQGCDTKMAQTGDFQDTEGQGL